MRSSRPLDSQASSAQAVLSLSAAKYAEGFVLAGGRSTRMGRDKALLRVSGGALIELALDKLRRSLPAGNSTLRIAGSRPDLASYAPVLSDLHAGCGPLSGIEAGLAATEQELNLFLPVDLPLLPPEFLGWMLSRAATTEALATMPRIQGLPQPLCAVYRRDLLPWVSRSLDNGVYKVIWAVCSVQQEDGAMGEVDAFDVELLFAAYPEFHALSPVPWRYWFQNCNRPEDLTVLGMP
jgi:molybdenum cofactor guanylyltransferase